MRWRRASRVWKTARVDMASSLTITEPNGAPIEKTLAAWGLRDDWTIRLNNFAPDTLSLVKAGDAEGVAPAYQSRIKLVVDDIIIFQGVVVSDPRSADGRQRSTGIECEGPWFFFRAQYQLGIQSFVQFTTPNDPGTPPIFETLYLTHFTLNRDSAGILLRSRAQLSAILDYVLAKANDAFGYAPFQYQAADLVDEPVLPQDVHNPTCEQAVQYQFELMNAVVWFDYTQDPPRFYCKRRNDCATRTFTIGDPGPLDANPQRVAGVNMVRRYDREVTYVKIAFESSANGFPIVVNDIWPVDPGDRNKPAPGLSEFFPLICTVPLRGFSSTSTSVTIKTIPIAVSDVNFWKDQVADTAEFANMRVLSSLHPRPELPHLILNEVGIPDWLAGTFGKQTLIAQISYANVDGTNTRKRRLRITATTTNLDFPNGKTFTNTTVNDFGESPADFLGTARTCYEDLNTPAYEGDLTVIQRVNNGTITLGLRINLANGKADWAAMNALAQSITIRGGSGKLEYGFSFGAGTVLTPGILTEKLRAKRLAYQTAAVLISGSSIRAGHIVLPPLTAVETTGMGDQAMNIHVVSDEETPATAGATPKTGLVELSAHLSGTTVDPTFTLKKKIAQFDDVTAGSVNLALSETAGSAIRFRDIAGCWQGKFFKCRIPRGLLQEISEAEAAQIMRGGQ